MLGPGWYRSYFPLSFSRDRAFLTGEASPYYIFHPHVPQRLASTLPEAKLILLLRNPIDRAYSHYRHNVKFGFERGTFEEALARERELLPGETQLLNAQADHNSFVHRHLSYVARGLYVDQIAQWLNSIPRQRLLLLKSEELFTNPTAVFSRVLDFLGLAEWSPSGWRTYNKGDYRGRMRPDTRSQLAEFFEPYNQQLANSVGFDVDDWN